MVETRPVNQMMNTTTTTLAPQTGPVLVNPNPMTTTTTRGGFAYDSNRKAIVKQQDNMRLLVGIDERHSSVQTSKNLLDGQLPSNQQIDASLIRLKSILGSSSPNLSRQGQKLVQDLTLLLESLQKVVNTKNANGTWQKLFAETNVVGKETALRTKQTATELRSQTDLTQQQMAEKARLESKEFFTNLRDVLLFIIRSPEFRDTLVDSLALTRSMFKKIDSRHGDRLTQSIRHDLVERPQQTRIVENQTTTYMNTDQSVPLTTTTSTLGTSQYLNTGEEIVLEQPILSRGSETETKKVGSDVFKEAKDVWKEEEETRNQMHQKMERMLDRLASEPQYAVVINKLFALYDQFYKISMTSRDKLSHQQTEQQQQYDVIINDAKIVLGSFAGQAEVNEFYDRSLDLMRRMSHDEQAMAYFREFRAFITESLKNPADQAFVQDSSMTLASRQRRSERIRYFIDNARIIFRGKYSDDFKMLLNLAKGMVNNFKNDETRIELNNRLTQMLKDCILDDSGKPDLFVAQESLTQMQRLLSGVVREQLVGVPLPLIEGETDKIRFAVNNMVLDAHDILPDHINIQLINNFDYQTRLPTSNAQVVTRLHVTVDSIRMGLRGVNYDVQYLKFPKFHDVGIADVDITGDGGFGLVLDIDISMTSNRAFRFALVRCLVSIDRLNVNIRQARHKMLDKIVLALFKNMIKKRIAHTMQVKLSAAIEDLFRKMNTFIANKEVALSQKGLGAKMNTMLKTGTDKGKNLNIGGKLKTQKAKMSSAVHKIKAKSSTSGTTTQPTLLTSQPLTTATDMSYSNVTSHPIATQSLSQPMTQPIVQPVTQSFVTQTPPLSQPSMVQPVSQPVTQTFVQQQPFTSSTMMSQPIQTQNVSTHPNILPTSSSLNKPMWSGDYQNQVQANAATESVGLKKKEQLRNEQESRLAPA